MTFKTARQSKGPCRKPETCKGHSNNQSTTAFDMKVFDLTKCKVSFKRVLRCSCQLYSFFVKSALFCVFPWIRSKKKDTCLVEYLHTLCNYQLFFSSKHQIKCFLTLEVLCHSPVRFYLVWNTNFKNINLVLTASWCSPKTVAISSKEVAEAVKYLMGDGSVLCKMYLFWALSKT